MRTSLFVVAVASVLTQACAPALTVTRRVPPAIEVGAELRKLAVLTMGDPSLTPAAQAGLERRIIDSGTYQLVALCEVARPCGPFDAWLRADVAPVQVTTPAATKEKPTPDTEVKVRVDFEVVRVDGTVAARRTLTNDVTVAAGSKDTVTERALHGLDLAMDDFVRSICPTTVAERLEFDTEGPLANPVKKAVDGDLAGAEAELKALLAASPDSAGAIFDLAVLAEVKGDFTAAAAGYEKAHTLAQKPMYWNALEALRRRQADMRRMQGR